MLERIKLSDDASVDRRLVALLWYIPVFLRWQKERVQEKRGDVAAFDRVINRVQGILEEILGVP